MKKIIAIIATIFVAFTMISCTKNYSFSLTVDSVSELRTSLVFEYTLKDEEKALTKSTVKADLSVKGAKSVLASKTLSFSTDKNAGSVTFTGLDANKDYSIRIYAGYNGKSVDLYKNDVKTTTQGTKDNPYQIAKASDFSTLVKNDPSGYFELTADIDFEGSSIAPMFTTTSVSSTSSSAFTGHFDGKNYTIKNFTYGKDGTPITLSTAYYGFFGCIADTGVVENIVLDTFNVYVAKSAKGYFGLLAGYNAGTVKNIKVLNSTLNVTSSGASVESVVGGLVAHNALSGVIDGADLAADINVKCKRTTSVGGVVGYNQTTKDNNKISNVKYTGAIDVNVENTSSSTYTATISVGGIIGINEATVDTATSDATITVKSSFEKPSSTTYDIYVGGIAGHNRSDKALLKKATALASFDVKSYDALVVKVGGITGQNGAAKAPVYATILDCTYTAKQTSIINVTDTVELGTGLVAIDKATGEKKYNATNAFTFHINYFKKVVTEEGEGDNKKQVITYEKEKEETIEYDQLGSKIEYTPDNEE